MTTPKDIIGGNKEKKEKGRARDKMRVNIGMILLAGERSEKRQDAK